MKSKVGSSNTDASCDCEWRSKEVEVTCGWFFERGREVTKFDCFRGRERRKEEETSCTCSVGLEFKRESREKAQGCMR